MPEACPYVAQMRLLRGEAPPGLGFRMWGVRALRTRLMRFSHSVAFWKNDR